MNFKQVVCLIVNSNANANCSIRIFRPCRNILVSIVCDLLTFTLNQFVVVFIEIGWCSLLKSL